MLTFDVGSRIENPNSSSTFSIVHDVSPIISSSLFIQFNIKILFYAYLQIANFNRFHAFFM